jgi:hypothetical protein
MACNDAKGLVFDVETCGLDMSTAISYANR